MDPKPASLPDWAYPAEEDVPESLTHLRQRTLLYLQIKHYLSQRSVRALTGSDQFVYWVEGDTRQAVAPDVYVVLDEDPARQLRVWMTWREGRAPDLAVEIVSVNRYEDYEIAPRHYAEAGVRELIIVDPLEGRSRRRWQVYRRDAAGELVSVVQSDDDAVPSVVLGCHLRFVPDGAEGPEIRLAEGAEGEVLLPTEVEALRAALEAERAALEAERAALEAERAATEAERAATEAERAATEAERAAKEHERALRLAAEAELEALRARIAARDEE